MNKYTKRYVIRNNNQPLIGCIGGYMQCSNSIKSSTFFSGNSTSFMSFSLNMPTNIARKTGDHAARTSLWTYNLWSSTNRVTLENSSSTRKSKKSPSITDARQFHHSTDPEIQFMDILLPVQANFYSVGSWIVSAGRRRTLNKALVNYYVARKCTLKLTEYAHMPLLKLNKLNKCHCNNRMEHIIQQITKLYHNVITVLRHQAITEVTWRYLQTSSL